MSPHTRRFMNDPNRLVEEMLEGYVAAHSDIVRYEHGLIVRSTPKPRGRVGLVISNGSGHEPAMIGWVGEGLFDVNVPGPIFSAPGPGPTLAGIKAADRGGGVLLLVSNHAGDLMNAELAMADARDEGIKDIDMAVLYDDVASAPKERSSERRGGVGLFFVWKIVGALAERGAPLESCVEMARNVRDRTRSISAAVGTVTHPVSGQPLGDPDDQSVRVGMGVHGEPGTRLGDDVSADEIAELLVKRLVEDAELESGENVAVLLNNAGSMTLMELSILYRGTAAALHRRDIGVVRSWIGSYATTLDLRGFSLAICRMDEEVVGLYDDPARGAAFTMVGDSR